MSEVVANTDIIYEQGYLYCCGRDDKGMVIIYRRRATGRKKGAKNVS